MFSNLENMIQYYCCAFVVKSDTHFIRLRKTLLMVTQLSITNSVEQYTLKADSKISLYARLHKKQYSENFAFLNLRILELFTREVCIFS